MAINRASRNQPPGLFQGIKLPSSRGISFFTRSVNEEHRQRFSTPVSQDNTKKTDKAFCF